MLTFHGIVERLDDPVVQVNHLELGTFERLVDRIRSEYAVVTLDDVAAALAGEAVLPPRALALTFDDGYRSVCELADPLLRRHGLPYAVFVPPALIDAGGRVPTYVMRAALELTDQTEVRLRGRRAVRLETADDREAAARRAAAALRELPHDEADLVVAELRELLTPAQWADADRRFASEELMGWDDIRRLASSGVTVGSHTRDHTVLHARQEPGEISAQVAESRRALEERLGLPCRHFSYPHGSPRDVCPAAVEAVRQAGYSTGFMNVGGPVREGMAPELLPRMPVVPSEPGEALSPRRQLSQSKWHAEIAAELVGG